MQTDLPRHVAATFPRMLDLLEKLVNVDSGTGLVDGIEQIQKIVEPALYEIGFDIERIPAGKYGTHILATKPGHGPRLLLIGHIDTVFPAGTVTQRPFQIEGNRVFGPGVYDAKSGIVCMLFALEALKAISPDALGRLDVQAFVSCDEEHLSPTSANLVQDLAANSQAALVFEPARPDGSYVTHRKGAARYRLNVTGRASHAGLNPEGGASAVHELAVKISAMSELSDLERGLSVNVGVIQGGQAFNVVAPNAEAEIDVRAWSTQEMEAVDAAIGRIVSESTTRGTTAQVERLRVVMPMERTPATDRLLAFVGRVASGLGEEVNGVGVGGVTDGNNASQRTTTIDGFGPIGDGAHTPHEYVELPSVASRTVRDALILRAWAIEPPDLNRG